MINWISSCASSVGYPHGYPMPDGCGSSWHDRRRWKTCGKDGLRSSGRVAKRGKRGLCGGDRRVDGGVIVGGGDEHRLELGGGEVHAAVEHGVEIAAVGGGVAGGGGVEVGGLSGAEEAREDGADALDRAIDFGLLGGPGEAVAVFGLALGACPSIRLARPSPEWDTRTAPRARRCPIAMSAADHLHSPFSWAFS